MPRSSHAEWSPNSGRPDPVAILEAQAETRLPDLVPLRHARMLVSPFTFYRAGAAIMAADLASTPSSGIVVQCCGDAHVANFGGYESPERKLVFSINDFDETLPGPWEWDVKRLAASFVIASQDRGFDDKIARGLVRDTARSYRDAMRQFASQRNLDVWYAHLDVEGILQRWQSDLSKGAVKLLERRAAKATTKNSLKAFAKLTEHVDGEIRIRSDPPVLERFEDLVSPDAATEIGNLTRRWIQSYRRTLQPDRRHLLDGYRMVDFARKVVGVGSVGTRCWIVLLLGNDDDDPLFLQIKEADRSVLEPYLKKSQYTNNGQRVVNGQRLMQSASDIFLGWDRAKGFDGADHDFYVRQLWDGKISADLTAIPPHLLRVYGLMCGWTLARAHARSGDRIAIATYLGTRDTFDRAMVDFAFAYAEQNACDFAAATEGVRAGRLAIA